MGPQFRTAAHLQQGPGIQWGHVCPPGRPNTPENQPINLYTHRAWLQGPFPGPPGYAFSSTLGTHVRPWRSCLEALHQERLLGQSKGLQPISPPQSFLVPWSCCISQDPLTLQRPTMEESQACSPTSHPTHRGWEMDSGGLKDNLWGGSAGWRFQPCLCCSLAVGMVSLLLK